jgi:hypothetical protein
MKSQWPKYFGCAMAAHEGLAGGLIGAAGALFAAWLSAAFRRAALRRRARASGEVLPAAGMQHGIRLSRSDAGFCTDERILCPLPASGSSGYGCFRQSQGGRGEDNPRTCRRAACCYRVRFEGRALRNASEEALSRFRSVRCQFAFFTDRVEIFSILAACGTAGGSLECSCFTGPEPVGAFHYPARRRESERGPSSASL